MHITLADYFGPWVDEIDEYKEAAEEMLDKVNRLLMTAEAHGVDLKINPVTKTYVSGKTYGGFRPQDCPQGAPQSSHKQARAVDVYDPQGELDRWITDARLAEFDLYREHPNATAGWCHLSDKAPKSGRRTFIP